MKEIFTRKSERVYLDKEIDDKDIKEILKAAMQAPSAGNQKPWEFVVVKSKETMKKIDEFHPYAQALKTANALIVVCGNLSKERFKGYWVQDCSASIENILLEAKSKNIGSVWIGIYPEKPRVDFIKELLGLPEDVIPLSIVAIGYPEKETEAVSRFNESLIHYEKY